MSEDVVAPNMAQGVINVPDPSFNLNIPLMPDESLLIIPKYDTFTVDTLKNNTISPIQSTKKNCHFSFSPSSKLRRKLFM